MDLSTSYMGLRLASPLVASPSPLSHDLDSARQLEDAGAAAIVMHSLFEEQIQYDVRQLNYFLEYGTERFPESLTYFPDKPDYVTGPQEYLAEISRFREALGIPVIASLNAVSQSAWADYAAQMQQAGANGLELNIYFLPTNPQFTGQEIEQVHLDILQTVKAAVSIPVAVKMSPFFSSIPNMAHKLVDAGADALVLFNRFYQPDIDVENLEVRPRLVLSTSEDNRLPLRWIAILFGRTPASLAATSGIHTGRDAVKLVMGGADVTMMCSALLRNGLGHIATVRQQMTALMEEMEYESLDQMKGVLSHRNTAEPAAFERANYMKTLQSFVATGTLE
ncbi:MAG: dihydroorotate dehydrogenase-like protein [Planctomycetaceae bacterium]|nr:dihydroorotate dehydrogenase-like protein [Planctomycetaceae bacterium]